MDKDVEEYANKLNERYEEGYRDGYTQGNIDARMKHIEDLFELWEELHEVEE